MGNIQVLSTLENIVNQKKAIFHSSSTVFLGIFNGELGIDTEISLLNHFLLKRGVSDVVARCELRDLSGDILNSFNIAMNEERTYSIKLSNIVKTNFIGSIYIFFNSSENLAVPFCAVTGVIKSPNSVCGLHTYGRRLEQKELGTKIDLKETVETGWIIKDTKNTRSFAVMHGGQFELNLNIKIECSNNQGAMICIEFEKKLEPFGTLLLIPQDLSSLIIGHLNGKKGHAKIFIKGLEGVFPRMLCGNYAVKTVTNNKIIDASEIQFTHTNFDFSNVSQPDSDGNFGYYNQPSLPNGYGIVYPVETPKTIEINREIYISNTIHNINVNSMEQASIKSLNDNLPSRFVAAAVGVWDNSILESECSTGIFIEEYLRSPTHWHWGLLKPGFETGEVVISIILNKFNRNEDLSRVIKLKFFGEDGYILEKDITVNESIKIDAMDMLPRILPKGALWYVLTSEKLEDINAFSTFYPNGKSGFTEHAF
jgi:hypothetical protein